MAPRMAKLTTKNQLTLPRALVEELGNPVYFRLQVCQGVLLLWPATLVCPADKAGPSKSGAGKAGAAAGPQHKPKPAAE